MAVKNNGVVQRVVQLDESMDGLNLNTADVVNTPANPAIRPSIAQAILASIEVLPQEAVMEEEEAVEEHVAPNAMEAMISGYLASLNLSPDMLEKTITGDDTTDAEKAEIIEGLLFTIINNNKQAKLVFLVVERIFNRIMQDAFKEERKNWPINAIFSKANNHWLS